MDKLEDLILSYFSPLCSTRLIREKAPRQWSTLRRGVTPDDIRSHLDGTATIGLWPGPMTRLVAYDVDAHGGDYHDIVKPRAEAACDYLLGEGIEPLVTTTPRNGYHIYILLDTPVGRDELLFLARDRGPEIFGDLWYDGKEIDVFPQRKGLRLPCGGGMRLLEPGTLEPLHEDHISDVTNLGRIMGMVTIPATQWVGNVFATNFDYQLSVDDEGHETWIYTGEPPASDVPSPKKRKPGQTETKKPKKRKPGQTKTKKAANDNTRPKRVPRTSRPRHQYTCAVVPKLNEHVHGVEWMTHVRRIEREGAIESGSVGDFEAVRQIVSMHRLVHGEERADTLRAVMRWVHRVTDEPQIQRYLTQVAESSLERIEKRIETGELRIGGKGVAEVLGLNAKYSASQLAGALLKEEQVIDAITARLPESMQNTARAIVMNIRDYGTTADHFLAEHPDCRGRVTVDGRRVRRIQAAREALIEAGFVFRYRGHYAAGGKVAKYALDFPAVVALRKELGLEALVIPAPAKLRGVVAVERPPSEFDACGRARPAAVAATLLDVKTRATLLERVDANARDYAGQVLDAITEDGLVDLEAEIPGIPLIRYEGGYGLDFRAVRTLRSEIGQPPVVVVPDAAMTDILEWFAA